MGHECDLCQRDMRTHVTVPAVTSRQGKGQSILTGKASACVYKQGRLLSQGHQGALTGLAFSADGSALATVCEDRALRLYRMDSVADSGLTFRRRRASPSLLPEE